MNALPMPIASSRTKSIFFIEPLRQKSLIYSPPKLDRGRGFSDPQYRRRLCFFKSALNSV